MYLEYFGLHENPFSISPNPNYLYMSERHKEALAHLSFGLGDTGGFVLLTGEVGTGKTTVSRALLQQLPETSDVGFVLNPSLNELDLLASICDAFDLTYPEQTESLKSLSDPIKQFLLKQEQQGRSTVLLVDEAQHLSAAALEQLRLLTNIETDTKKLLRVVLIGQPELQQMLKQPMLRQLAQRITARYHLLPLTLREVDLYIQYRLLVAGTQQPLFSQGICKLVFKATQGIPRLINLLCDRALLAAYASNSLQVEPKNLRRAQIETGLKMGESHWPYMLASACSAGLVLCAALAWSLYPSSSQPSTDLTPPAVIAAPKVDALVKQQQAEQDYQQRQQQADLAFAQWQQLRNAQHSPKQARQTLLEAWGYQVPIHQAKCTLLSALSLQCLSLQGGLSRLKAINLPAVVNLNEHGRHFYAVLRTVGEELELWMGDQRVFVSEQWLIQRWDGDFEVLWQAPQGFNGALKPGSQGEAVTWLSNSLALLEGELPTKRYDYDYQVVEQVRRFQQDNLLAADGIAGVFTLLKLNQLLHAEQPKLQDLY